MGVFDSINEVSSKAIHSGEQYVKISRAYYKLKSLQILSKSLSAVLKIVGIGVLLFLALIFLSIAAVFWIGKELNSYALACLIIAGFYIILGILLYFIKDKFDAQIIKKLSEEFYE